MTNFIQRSDTSLVQVVHCLFIPLLPSSSLRVVGLSSTSVITARNGAVMWPLVLMARDL